MPYSSILHGAVNIAKDQLIWGAKRATVRYSPTVARWARDVATAIDDTTDAAREVAIQAHDALNDREQQLLSLLGNSANAVSPSSVIAADTVDSQPESTEHGNPDNTESQALRVEQVNHPQARGLPDGLEELANELLAKVSLTSEMMDDTDHREACPLIVQYRTISGSRRIGLSTDMIDTPFAFASHWSLEVDGVFFELRANPAGDVPAPSKDDGRVILHQEFGAQERKIKLQVTKNRAPLSNSGSFTAGSTKMSTKQIIFAASMIFRKFENQYDVLVDNCQLFIQLLCEAIGGTENESEIRSKFNRKSIMILPALGSWLTIPAYYATACFDYSLEHLTKSVLKTSKLALDSTDCSAGPLHCTDCLTLETWKRVARFRLRLNKFYYHARVYRSRKQLLKDLISR